MIYQLTPKQRAWFDDASEPERLAFLSKGPADVPPLINRKTGKHFYRPTVRGVLIAEKACKTYDAAMVEAEAFLADCKVKASDTHLDERTLGIDDAYRNLGERLGDKSIRIDWAVPLLGLSDALPEVLEEWLEDIDTDEITRFKDDMPAFARIFGEQVESEDNQDGDDVRRWDRADRADMFAEAVSEDRLFGVIIQASQPVRTSFGERSFSYSWGHTYFRKFYGDTLEAVIEKAIAWGEANWAEKPEPLAAAEAHQADPIAPRDGAGARP